MKYILLMVIAGIIAAGLFLGWLGSGGRSSSLSSPASAEDTPPYASPGELPTLTPAPPPPTRWNGDPAAGGAADLQSDEATDWPDPVEQLASLAVDDPEKARDLLLLFPRLPAGSQVEAAHHLSNLLSDEDYPKLGQFLTNVLTPEPVLDALLAGLLGRKDDLKLPTLSDIARQERHPRAEEARELLEAFLGAPLDEDKSKWNSVVQQWLERTRAEMAAESSSSEDDLPGELTHPEMEKPGNQ